MHLRSPPFLLEMKIQTLSLDPRIIFLEQLIVRREPGLRSSLFNSFAADGGGWLGSVGGTELTKICGWHWPCS
jgi:hypothetical protein